VLLSPRVVAAWYRLARRTARSMPPPEEPIADEQGRIEAEVGRVAPPWRAS
jgi:hypothetical protein